MTIQLSLGQEKRRFNRPVIMGVLNVTPDSFSDGGFFISPEKALRQALAMIEQGADIIDIGGESTRPGAQAVSIDQEMQRVLPVIELLRRETDCIISIDTSKPDVMRAAVNAGADMINDVCALQKDNALAVAAQLDKPVCLMHMQGEPRSMQENPQYADVVEDVHLFLKQRAESAIAAGVRSEHVILDPGFGFGKNLQQNLSLAKHLSRFKDLHCPLLVGVSRKSSIGAILDKPVTERLIGSVVLAAILLQNGANIMRVHDVAATADMIKIVQAVLQAQ